jgi:hypothetical protein
VESLCANQIPYVQMKVVEIHFPILSATIRQFTASLHCAVEPVVQFVPPSNGPICRFSASQKTVPVSLGS